MFAKIGLLCFEKNFFLVVTLAIPGGGCKSRRPYPSGGVRMPRPRGAKYIIVLAWRHWRLLARYSVALFCSLASTGRMGGAPAQPRARSPMRWDGIRDPTTLATFKTARAGTDHPLRPHCYQDYLLILIASGHTPANVARHGALCFSPCAFFGSGVGALPTHPGYGVRI